MEPPPGFFNIELIVERLRFLRCNKLIETDKYVLPDYPITEEKREEWKVYRQELRDMLTNVKVEDLKMDYLFHVTGCIWPLPPSP